MNSKEIRQSISKLLLEQQAIALKGFDAESRAKFDKIQKDVDSLEADAARLEAMEARSASEQEFRRVPRPGAVGADMSSEERSVKVKAAFKEYCLRGFFREPGVTR